MVDKSEILSEIIKLVGTNPAVVVIIIVVLLSVVAGLIFVSIKLIITYLKDIRKIPNLENLHNIFENQLSDFHDELHEVRNKIGEVEILSLNHPEIYTAIEELKYKVEHILDVLDSTDGKCLTVHGRLENHEARIKKMEIDGYAGLSDLRKMEAIIIKMKTLHKENHDQEI